MAGRLIGQGAFDPGQSMYGLGYRFFQSWHCDDCATRSVFVADAEFWVCFCSRCGKPLNAEARLVVETLAKKIEKKTIEKLLRKIREEIFAAKSSQSPTAIVRKIIERN